MTKSVKFAIITILIILLLSVTAIIAGNYWAKNNSLTAMIYQNGILIHSIDLSAVTTSYEITVTDGAKSNSILIEHNSVSMIDATCPDHICVKTGKINSPLTPITCLPNKVVIKISGSNSDNLDIISH